MFRELVGTTYYEVQTRNQDTGYWEHAITLRPEYRTVIEHRTWFIFWTKEVLVIPNLREAEDQARRTAILHAKSYRNRRALFRESRVLKRYETPIGPQHETIWCNGKFSEYCD